MKSLITDLNTSPEKLLEHIKNSGWLAKQVANDLAVDMPEQDISGLLVATTTDSQAEIIAKEDCIVCGSAWLAESVKQMAIKLNCTQAKITYNYKDGDLATAGSILFSLTGNSRLLLAAERTSLNFLQTLSATATLCHQVTQWDLANCIILDTRKTLPSLRLSQKYAVKIGGCFNHRTDLSAMFLIKENHIKASGSIKNAVTLALSIDINKPIEVEVENLSQLTQALELGVDQIMLDNFSQEEIKQAVVIRNQQKSNIPLEVSGIEFVKENVEAVAKLGIEYISIGALTKNCQAIDLSMLIK